MKTPFVSILFLIVIALPATAAPYGKLPLRFERNRGQSAAEVEYLSRGRNYTLFLTGSEAVLSLRQPSHGKPAVLRMSLIGAKTSPAIAGEEQLQGKINYLVGNDRSQWHTGVPTYRRVRYGDVWPGIDMVWHGTQNALEYDFIVRPGVDPSRIRMRFEGASRLLLDNDGSLIAQTAAGDVIQHAPVVYQESANGRTRVRGQYVLEGKRDVGFELGAYDASRPLIIDPVLVYSTYLGGSLADDAFAIAVDSQGQAYVTGTTESGLNDFPQRGGLERAGGDFFLFITKLNADGSDLVYSTLIGTNGAVTAKGIAVTSDGKACITGGTENVSNDSDYPVTENAWQRNGACCGRRNGDAIITMLNAEGDKILYSTFYGGSALFSDDKAEDIGEGVAVDAHGLIYITGSTSSNDLDTPNGFQRSRKSAAEGTDAFVAVFDPNQPKGGDTLLYASYLGGKDDDEAFGIAADDDRNAYVGGRTRSADLKTKSPIGQSLPPLQANFQGDSFDGFVAKIDTEQKEDSSLTYLTYFGGNGNDRVESIAVDAFQRAYITGATRSEANAFPLLNAFDVTQFNGEAFVAKLNADGTALFYCSFLGGENGNVSGTDFEEGMGIAIDSLGNAYVTGNTTSRDTFPTSEIEAPLPPEQRGTAFVAKIEASNSAAFLPQLIYSTTFGGSGTKAAGIAVDANGDAYIAGSSTGALPTTPDAFQAKFAGVRDAFVAKMKSGRPDTTGLYDSASNEFLLRNKNTTGGPDLTVVFGQAGDLPVVGDWDADGVTDVGVFRPSTGQFLLQQGAQTLTINFVGAEGDLPLAGDWDGDGFDTIGVFRADPKTGASFFLTNARAVDNDFPNVDIQFSAGQAGDLPLGGDWDGDGLETVGLYQPSTTTFFLFNAFVVGNEITFAFGLPGALPLAGDWNADNTDGVGVYLAASRSMHLTDDFGLSELTFQFQARAGEFPLGGKWDGQ